MSALPSGDERTWSSGFLGRCTHFSCGRSSVQLADSTSPVDQERCRSGKRSSLWRMDWRATVESPANRHNRDGLENRYRRFRRSRVQNPPPPLDQAASRTAAAEMRDAAVFQTAPRQSMEFTLVSSRPPDSGITGARLAHDDAASKALVEPANPCGCPLLTGAPVRVRSTDPTRDVLSKRRLKRRRQQSLRRSKHARLLRPAMKRRCNGRYVPIPHHARAGSPSQVLATR